ncbi:STAS domain-containing protein [Pseudonocardia sp. HH130629-09]|uniref:STAS domain-containing protein n=1 Tax=Pseudonocardia sp. HH130629-09 TaxID=1641402 RepID=UPI0009E6D10A|nr:STAS domain-containing protein [Pseudonocardia sp. HH130629-09]
MTDPTEGAGGVPGLSAATEEGGGLTLEAVPHPSGPVALHVVGDVDLATAPFLAEQVGDWLAASPRVVLDLSGVGVFASAGISVLLDCQHAAVAAGVVLELYCGAARQVRRVLQVTGTCEHLRVLDPHPPPETPDGRAPLFPVPD